MSGDPYIKENERLEAEIARLQDWKRKQMEDIMTLGQQVGKLEMERDRLRAALEKIIKVESDDELDGLDDVIGIARKALAKEGK